MDALIPNGPRRPTRDGPHATGCCGGSCSTPSATIPRIYNGGNYASSAAAIDEIRRSPPTGHRKHRRKRLGLSVTKAPTAAKADKIVDERLCDADHGQMPNDFILSVGGASHDYNAAEKLEQIEASLLLINFRGR